MSCNVNQYNHSTIKTRLKLQKFFFSNVTKSKADRFRVEMESMPPVRVQEVQAKQLEIVQLARQMQDEERISLAIVSVGPGAN